MNPTRVTKAVEKLTLNKGVYFIKVDKYGTGGVSYLMYEIGYKVD
jgi:hypothetical protein